MVSAIKKRYNELISAGRKRMGVKLQDKLGSLSRTVAQRLQHSHMTEIAYLTQSLESTHQEWAHWSLKSSPSGSENIISQEKELRGLIQEYLVSNQKLSHFLNQPSLTKLEGKAKSTQLMQTWHNLKQFYHQQEDKENQVVSKYKEFQRMVKGLQQQRPVKAIKGY